MKTAAILFIAFALSACDSGSPKQIYIVQQQSLLEPKWDDLFLVYGCADNYAEAKNIADHYTSTYQGRSYRLVSKTISQSEYETLQKRLHIK